MGELMLQAFLLKRFLLEAVAAQNLAGVQQLLSQLGEAGLLKVTVQQPVNKDLDSLLHVAVRTGDIGIVTLLLESGASPWQRNYNGDTPMQWCVVPKFWS